MHYSKYIVPFLAVGLVFFAYGTSGSQDVQNTNQVQGRLHDLALSVENGTISKMEVLQMPSDILTRTRNMPEMLEKQFHHKLMFQLVRGSSPLVKLTKAAKSASANPQAEAADLRSAILFYSDEGKRIGAICFNARGTRGYVDDTSVSFTGGLFPWVEGTFSNWL